MFKQIKKINDVSNYTYSTFEFEILSGFITFINSDNVLYVFDSNNLEILVKIKLEDNYGLSFIDNTFYLKKGDDSLFKLNIKAKRLEHIYTTTIKDGFSYSIGLLTKDLVIKTKSKIINFEIVELEQKVINIISNKEIYYLNELNYLMFIQNNFAYLHSFKNDNVVRRNIITNEECYNLKLDNGAFGQRILGQTEDIFYLQRAVSKPNIFNVLALEKNTGKIIWETENAHAYYCYDRKNNKLYGLGDKRFEVINTLTGEKELVAELDVNVYVFSHLTFYNNGLLYFSSHLDNNIPVFGAVNVKTGELDFIQEVKIEGEKSFRIGIEKPIVVDNRLYVKDSFNTLHIFEKTVNETT